MKLDYISTGVSFYLITGDQFANTPPAVILCDTILVSASKLCGLCSLEFPHPNLP